MTRIAAPPVTSRISRLPCAADADLMFPIDESVRPEQAPSAGERAALAVCAPAAWVGVRRRRGGTVRMHHHLWVGATAEALVRTGRSAGCAAGTPSVTCLLRRFVGTEEPHPR